MPNHIVNEIRLHGIGADEVRRVTQGPNGVVDFSTLLPLPLNYWPGSTSILHERAFPGTHLKAAREMWGTKWNAYALCDDSLRADGGDTLLTFETAWAPPRGWVVAMFSTLRCNITHFWQDEGSEEVEAESYVFDEETAIGHRWDHRRVEKHSPDYRRLHKLQWGVETPEELGRPT